MLITHRLRQLSLPSSPSLRFLLLLVIAVTASSVQAQFSSGSTGADGAFNPVTNTTLQIPESGIFNFTTINIPQNIEVRFIKNSKNTSLTILASGNVIIAGRIFVDGSNRNGRFGGEGGPGGFRGGNGGTFLDVVNGTAGDGPGGGSGGIAGANGVASAGAGGFLRSGGNGILKSGDATIGQGGARYGTRVLLPLIGGSGGGGGSSSTSSTVIGGGGGGGGGAILIASSSNISFPDNSDSTRGIYARAGIASGDAVSAGGSGSGGAIRIVANTVSGTPCFDVSSGPDNFNIPTGSPGIIRVEAFNLSQYVPRCSSSEQTLGQPNPVTLANSPTLRIDSVGGVSAPASPLGLINAPPDVVVPTSVSNPVAVVVNATNLPSGTTIQVQLTPESGAPTSVNGTLSGSTSSSTTTVNMTLPSGGISVIRATVTLDVLVALGKPTFINGERVAKVEIASTFGGASELVYITRSGRRISQRELQH